ncbi:MAG: methyltransferase domain-containing protein [Acidobacteria bacterium]|nr:methyltransferase domain-containing protein [Acidobacteriota bacterium]
MPAPTLDALTSPTLKYLRERWWNDEFTTFVVDTLRPRPGNRILDVGSGEGEAEIHLGRRHVSQIRMFGVDLMIERVLVARRETAAHNQHVRYATADACALPFRDGVFDSTFCVAVLQHVGDVESAVREFARVTATGGRVIAVEPDNSARYLYSSARAGGQAFEAAARFFAAVAAARGGAPDSAVGPRLATLFARYGIEPLAVRLFPVSVSRLGAPSEEEWRGRRAAIEQAIDASPADAVRTLGRAYLDSLDEYASEAGRAGQGFVEIQNTMLFAAVGQKSE